MTGDRLPGCKSTKSDVCVLDENLEKVSLHKLLIMLTVHMLKGKT